jgi:hypothetical protein
MTCCFVLSFWLQFTKSQALEAQGANPRDNSARKFAEKLYFCHCGNDSSSTMKVASRKHSSIVQDVSLFLEGFRTKAPRTTTLASTHDTSHQPANTDCDLCNKQPSSHYFDSILSPVPPEMVGQPKHRVSRKVAAAIYFHLRFVSSSMAGISSSNSLVAAVSASREHDEKSS